MLKALLTYVLLTWTLALGQNPQTAVYPTGVAADTDLYVASNRGATTLRADPGPSSTVLSVYDPTQFTYPAIVSIDTELIAVCSGSGSTITVCSSGRGFDHTTAANHAINAPVTAAIAARYFNQMAAEIKAIEAGAANTTLSYSNPAWITALAATKLSGQANCANLPTFTGDITNSNCAMTVGVAFPKLATTNTWTGYNDLSAASFRWPEKTVSTLPSASAASARIYIVTDGTSASDCSGGGGTTAAVCRSNGSSWVSLGGSGAVGALLSTVSFSATPTFDGGNGTTKTFSMTVTGNITGCTLQNFATGQVVLFSFTMDSSAGHTIVCSGLTNLGSPVADGTSQALANYKQYFVATGSAALDSGGAPMWSSNYSPSGLGFATTSGGGSITFFGLSGAVAAQIGFRDLSGTVCLESAAFPCGSSTPQPGLGDGTNAIPATTYHQTSLVNKGVQAYTITSIACYTDNNGSSTLTATNGAGTALLTGPITCTNTIAGAAGTQSATTTIAVNDGIKFSFISDGTSTQTNWLVTITR